MGGGGKKHVITNSHLSQAQTATGVLDRFIPDLPLPTI